MENFKHKFIAIAFIIIISLVTIVTPIAEMRSIGVSLLGIKNSLPKNPTYVQIFNTTKSTVETAINNYIAFKPQFMEFFGAVQLVMDKKVILDNPKSNNTVYKMKNGQLNFIYGKTKQDENINSVVKLNQYLKDNNTKFLFVQAPGKTNKYDSEIFINGEQDFTNQNTEEFLNGIKSNNVEFLDLRENIKSESFEYGSLFFNTDHHWTTETAFWAYTQIFTNIKNKLSLKFEDYNRNINLDNFDKVKYYDKMLGSEGRRVGQIYGGADDYTLITPNFPTDYILKLTQNVGSDKTRKGEFKNSIIAAKIQTNKGAYSITYSNYISPDFPKIQITNNMVNEGKILVLQDSFGSPVSAFLSLNFNQLDIIDLRAYKEKTLYQYLEENKYEMIIMLYNPNSFNNEKLFKYE